MSTEPPQRGSLLIEMLVASLSYVAASLVVFKVVAPVQDLFFPQFNSHASLLFLPHGVRVLSAWLLGWRAVPALLPGVVIVFAFVGGPDVLLPSRIAAIAVAVSVCPAIFWALAQLGWDTRPNAGRPACWACVMLVGVLTSVLIALFTNLALGTGAVDYVAYLIGDVFGLFFLMLILMLVFRTLRGRDKSASF